MSEEVVRLWQKLGKLEAARPTPEQLLAFMRECPDDVGVDLARRMLDSADRAQRCIVADHDGLVDELRLTAQSLAEARRTLDAVDHWIDGEP